MADDTAGHLVAALLYAGRVSRVLPVDHDSDRRAAEALRRLHEQMPPPRKLKRKP